MIATLVQLLSWFGQIPYRVICFCLPFLANYLALFYATLANYILFFAHPFIFMAYQIGTLIFWVIHTAISLCVEIGSAMLAVFAPGLNLTYLTQQLCALMRSMVVPVARAIVKTTTLPYFSEAMLITSLCVLCTPLIVDYCSSKHNPAPPQRPPNP